MASRIVLISTFPSLIEVGRKKTEMAPLVGFKLVARTNSAEESSRLVAKAEVVEKKAIDSILPSIRKM